MPVLAPRARRPGRTRLTWSHPCCRSPTERSGSGLPLLGAARPQRRSFVVVRGLSSRLPESNRSGTLRRLKSSRSKRQSWRLGDGESSRAACSCSVAPTGRLFLRAGPSRRMAMSQILGCGEVSVMKRLRRRSDVELLASAPEDADAFAELYRRHEKAVLGYLMHWCRSADVAADLLAETFAKAFESAGRYRPELGEPRAWLVGIARHTLLRSVRTGRVQDETRRRLGWATIALEDEALERVEALGSRRADVAAALEGLSELLREAVAGRIIDEREYRDLAQALECSESVVRQRVRRGLAQMRHDLEVKR
jgi:RNA polymerase sigma factor (sigma-70 family)